jgi:hypothetical protein
MLYCKDNTSTQRRKGRKEEQYSWLVFFAAFAFFAPLRWV